MSALRGRRVVLGVAGGIAAYKAVDLCRRMVDAGAHVSVIMTEDAQRFVGEVTFSALSSGRVHTSLWDNASPIPHTRLGQSADLVIVAPATARVISAYATGYSWDLLVATLIATRAPVLVCPAMHTEMWEHGSVQDNLAVLRTRGVHIVEPETGRLAGGDVGTGRLASVEAIVARAEEILGATHDLQGVHVLVTAGGTREPIDAVRVIANRSSGKQGHAVAEEAMSRGARVTLVTTSDLPVPVGADVVRVETAAEMKCAVDAAAQGADVVVMTAAVADFRPVSAPAGKLKKESGPPEIRLEPTPDILAGLGAAKKAGQLLVGFAAETDDVEANARAKMLRKNLDIIVSNDVSAPGVGFGHDTNEVTIHLSTGECIRVPLASKRLVAARLLDSVVEARRRN